MPFNVRNFGPWEDPGRESPARNSSGVPGRCWNAMAHTGFVEDPFGAENYGGLELEPDWKISPAGSSGLK